ncbi:MAG: VWA domain-containing protein [Pirellulales bacterium]|nr:VWA domain-containing protein [Pirellulales bacterium]
MLRAFGKWWPHREASPTDPLAPAVDSEKGEASPADTWWRRPQGALPSVTSVFLHLTALALFAQLTISGYPQPLVREFEAAVNEEPPAPIDQPPTDLAIAEPSDERRESLFAAEAYSVAATAGADPLVETMLTPTVVAASDVRVPEVKMDDLAIVEGLEVDDLIVRRGSAGEEVASVEGAVDRITHEIVSNLEHGKLLVVWLMDASISLVDEHEAVAGRLERIYSELGELGSLQGDLLVNAVVSFGMETKILVPPTNEADKIVGAIRKIPVDDTGVENVFSAVLTSLDQFKSLRNRQDRRIMLVICTDESGDDYSRLEESIKLCQRLSVPVFTVGPSAMFGRQKGIHQYKHPDDGKMYPIEVDRGPDTARYELLRLPYWFDGPQHDRMSAGIGPFALTRLAVESGGVYFISDAAGDQSPFSLDAMRRYMPEYVSAGQYMREVRDSKLRQAILNAVDVTLAREAKGTPRLEFEPTGENFQDQLREAQQTVAFNSIIVQAALVGFGAKGLESEYEQEDSPRWQAWYDLTYGRLLAMQLRCAEYNFTCAEMKGKGADFVDTKSNRWTFRPAEHYRSGAAAGKQAEEARRLLNRCVEQNPGTPWAALAERELAHPFGFEIDERFVPRPEQQVGGGPNVMPTGRRVEQLRELERRQPPALPKL